MVPAQINREASLRIAFVGEAPSYEEVEQGKPLVGPSGRVFNSLLQTADIDRADCLYVGNVFDEQLPDNEVRNWCSPTKEARDGGFADLAPVAGAYLRPEHLHHLERLAAEMASLKPNCIVPLGGTALWAFMGTDNIGMSRGAVQAAKQILPGAKLLPTYHPAYVAKQWKAYTSVAMDLGRAAAEARAGPQITYPDVTILTEPTYTEALTFLSRAQAEADLLSVDIETKRGQVTAIGFSYKRGHGICIPFYDPRRANKSYWPSAWQEAAIWEAIAKVLEDPSVPKLGQNYGGYDAIFLLEQYGIKTMGMAHDTRLLSHAIYPELPKDLATLGANYTNLGPWKMLGPRAKKRDKRDD